MTNRAPAANTLARTSSKEGLGRPKYRMRQDRTVGGRQVHTYFQVGTPLEGAQLVCQLLDADPKNTFLTADDYGHETLVGGSWVEWQDREGFPINLAFPDWAWE